MIIEGTLNPQLMIAVIKIMQRKATPIIQIANKDKYKVCELFRHFSKHLPLILFFSLSALQQAYGSTLRAAHQWMACLAQNMRWICLGAWCLRCRKALSWSYLIFERLKTRFRILLEVRDVDSGALRSEKHPYWNDL